MMPIRCRRVLVFILVFSFFIGAASGCKKEPIKGGSLVENSGNDYSDISSNGDVGDESGYDSDNSNGNEDNSRSEDASQSNNSETGGSDSRTGGTGTPGTTPGTTPGKTTSPGPNTGKKVIEIWDSESNETLTLAAVDYESKNKNVTISIKQQGKTSLNMLKMAVAAKSAPDIVCMDQVYLVAAGNLSYLHDLTKYGANNVKSKFTDSCIKSITYQNKLYGLPFDANTICFIYNKDIINQAGAAVPTNYNELITASNKIKAKFGTSKYSYTVPFDGWNNKNWMAFNYFFWLWRMGGEILTPDLKKAAFNSTEGVQALQMLVNMKNDGLAAPTYKHNEFFSGQVGMIDIGSWTYNKVFGADKSGNFGVSLLPVLKTGVLPYSGLGLYCYGVTTGSKNVQEAYNFIEFYCTSSKYQLQYCKRNNFLPSLKGAYNDSFYSAPEWKVMIKQLGYSKFRPGVPNWDRMEESIADAVKLAVLGQKSPKEALDAAANNVNRLIK